MNITIFIGGISGGGAERVACNLAIYLSKQNHCVTLLTMSETANVYGVHSEVTLVSLLKESERSNKIRDNCLRYMRLKNYVNEHSFDTYVVMLPITISLLLHFRKSIKGKIIASERNDPLSNSRLSKFLMKHYAERADAWVFQTEDAAKWYDGITQTGTVIPNAINPDFIRPPYTGEREKSIVAAGRLSEQKNFKLLLDAFADISPEHPEYCLKIFGKGSLENELKTYAENLGVADKTQFMGYVSNMPEQLEKASLFVLSSNFEGMPNALMEAMALGLPCISTDCPAGGPKYLIKNGENGLLVPVGDKEKMRDAIRCILSNKEAAKKMGQKARKIAEELAPEYIYSRWENFIKGIVGDDNGKTSKIS